jgi:hypothetical protein
VLERTVAELAQRFDMTWRISYRARRKRVAVFVSKLDHCLFDILIRHQSGARRQGSSKQEAGTLCSWFKGLVSFAELDHCLFGILICHQSGARQLEPCAQCGMISVSS